MKSNEIESFVQVSRVVDTSVASVGVLGRITQDPKRLAQLAR